MPSIALPQQSQGQLPMSYSLQPNIQVPPPPPSQGPVYLQPVNIVQPSAIPQDTVPQVEIKEPQEISEEKNRGLEILSVKKKDEESDKDNSD